MGRLRGPSVTNGSTLIDSIAKSAIGRSGNRKLNTEGDGDGDDDGGDCAGLPKKTSPRMSPVGTPTLTVISEVKDMNDSA